MATNDKGNDIPAVPLTGKKRALDFSDSPASKRLHVDSDDSNISIKVLVPLAAVGALIGKKGDAMRTLRTDLQCHVHLSKNDETYPGTTERICYVKGRVQNVVKVIQAVLEKIHEHHDTSVPPDAFDHKGMSRGNEVKLVVPNSSVGLVVGKGGATIKDIRESFGCQIQTFPKVGSPEAQNCAERVITLGHTNHSQLIMATARVLEKVVADPNHACEINKEDGGKQMATQVITRKNQAFVFLKFLLFSIINNSSNIVTPINNFGASSTFAANPQPNLNLGSLLGGMGNLQIITFLENLRSTLRSSCLNEANISEIMSAMQILAKYNILENGLGLGVAALSVTRTESNPPIFTSNGTGGQEDQNVQPDVPAAVNPLLVEVLRTGCPTGGSGDNYAASLIVERNVSDDSMELEVPNSVVGAVLGPKGRTLQELHFYSGCKIQVSRREARSDLPTGTRLISLSGDGKCLHICRMMIERLVNESHDRRVGNTV